MTIIGYARVSTQEQNLDLQLDALKLAGCNKIYRDQGVSAVARYRPGFEAALNALSTGDIFVVWKLDRAFRSLIDTLTVLEKLEKQNIEFRCLTEPFDTTTPMGICMYQIRGVFAELERNFIRERTRAGIVAARKRGKVIGRPRKLTTEQIKQIERRLKSKPYVTRSQLSNNLGISTRTLSRALNGRKRLKIK